MSSSQTIVTLFRVLICKLLVLEQVLNRVFYIKNLPAKNRIVKSRFKPVKSYKALPNAPQERTRLN
ncbi:hypothetical protein BV917_17420 [Leptospira santarosai serovar Guaricura]|nr:hypothetical protein BV917_17420 [Leptospira santarosai serovar Guaricura]